MVPHLTFLLICSRLFSVSGFNVDLKNTSVFEDGVKGDETKSSYFGYDFILRVDPSSSPPIPRLVIGSPKYSPTKQGSAGTNSPGNIYSCPVALFTEPPSCTGVSPVKTTSKGVMTDNDSLGLSIIKGSNTESQSQHVMACAPLRARNCTSNYLTQGICYGSNNFGETWSSGTKQATQTCPAENVDIMFVLDGSGSVNNKDDQNFNRVKTWVKNVTSKFDLNGPTSVGVVQYSHWYRNRPAHMQRYVHTEIPLGEYQSQRMFQWAVDEIEIQGFTTYTAHAINKTVKDFQSSSRFTDPSTKKVMILLTDGRSNDRRQLPFSANYARSQGITTFAIGVADYSQDELNTISGDDERIYKLDDFTELDQIVDSLQISITGIMEGSNKNETNEMQNAQTGLSGNVGRVYLIYVE